MIPVRPAFGGLRALEAWWTMASCRGRDFFLCLCGFQCFFEMVKRRLHLEVGIRYSLPILAPVVRLVPAEDAWSYVPDGFLRIRSVFVLVGVVLGLSLPIYVCHYW
jgi:hypothetical protein